jgi:hypothetical protein
MAISVSGRRAGFTVPRALPLIAPRTGQWVYKYSQLPPDLLVPLVPFVPSCLFSLLCLLSLLFLWLLVSFPVVNLYPPDAEKRSYWTSKYIFRTGGWQHQISKQVILYAIICVPSLFFSSYNPISYLARAINEIRKMHRLARAQAF